MTLRRRTLFALATSDTLEAVVLRVRPLREAARSASHRYVAGESLVEAAMVARRLDSEGLGTSLDLFGENARSADAADAAADAVASLAGALEDLPGPPFLSVDLSHLGVDLGHEACLARLRRIAERLPAGARVQVGAEEERRADAIHAVVLQAAAAGVPIDATVQANLRRSPADAERLAAGGAGVRLVKGAYPGPPAVAHPWGPVTDGAFVALAGRLADLGADVALATHDPDVRRWALEAGGAARLELLLGVRDEDARALAREGRDVRLYVPFGPRWLRYWARRIAESQGA